MDSIHTCTSLMKPGCYRDSIDLKDAYFSIPIHRDHQRYLTFYWKNTLYKIYLLTTGTGMCTKVVHKTYGASFFFP